MKPRRPPRIALRRPSVAAWQAGLSEAETRVKRERQERNLEPQRAVAISLSMIGAARAGGRRVHYGDPVRRRGEEQVRAIWRRLRKAFPSAR